jgi:hypothetical protein
MNDHTKRTSARAKARLLLQMLRAETSAAESLQQTESLFAKNREPFFNAIDPFRPARSEISRAATYPPKPHSARRNLLL